MTTEFKHSGKSRRKLKVSLNVLKYQQRKWGHCEVREARIRDLERALKERK